MTTVAQKEALAANVTYCCQIWKITAKDGATLAYASCDCPVTIGGTTYQPFSPADPARVAAKTGLKPDSSEILSVFDDVITEADVRGGRWTGARIYSAFVVNYRDVTLGVVGEHNGFAGKVRPRGAVQFTMEFLSLSQALAQMIGDETSPIDRNRKPDDLGISMAAFTFAATVTAVTSTDRRTFTVNLSPAKADNYFQYGRAEWATGANAGLKMEVKSNTGNVMTLTLNMRSAIAVGDTLSLIAGYDSTREQARDKFGSTAIENFQGEPDLPGLKTALTYPE